jgi:hypothetical protein
VVVVVGAAVVLVAGVVVAGGAASLAPLSPEQAARARTATNASRIADVPVSGLTVLTTSPVCFAGRTGRSVREGGFSSFALTRRSSWLL